MPRNCSNRPRFRCRFLRRRSTQRRRRRAALLTGTARIDQAPADVLLPAITAAATERQLRPFTRTTCQSLIDSSPPIYETKTSLHVRDGGGTTAPAGPANIYSRSSVSICRFNFSPFFQFRPCGYLLRQSKLTTL